MTPEQEKAPSPNPNYHQGLSEAALPYEKLTTAQQAAVQSYEADIKAHPEKTTAQSWSPDFEKNIHVVKNAAVQMVINGLDGVVSTEFGAQMAPLFEPETKRPGPTADDLKMFENMPKWRDAAKKYTRRAVICKPHTTAEVDASLLRIKALGFSQMWLIVFENGKARIPGTGFPLDPACDPKADILAYAITEGKKKGITIYPVVDVYAWGKKRAERTAPVDAARRRFRAKRCPPFQNQ